MNDWLRAVTHKPYIYGNTAAASSTSIEALTKFYEVCIEEIIEILRKSNSQAHLKTIIQYKENIQGLVGQAIRNVLKNNPDFSSLQLRDIVKIKQNLAEQIVKLSTSFTDFENFCGNLRNLSGRANFIIEKIFGTSNKLVNFTRNSKGLAGKTMSKPTAAAVEKIPTAPRTSYTAIKELQVAAGETALAEQNAAKAASKGLLSKLLRFLKCAPKGKTLVFTWGGIVLTAVTAVAVFGEGSKDAISGGKDYVSYNKTPIKYRKIFDEEQHDAGQNLHDILDEKFQKSTYPFKDHYIYIYTMFAAQTKDFPEAILNNMIGIYIRLIEKKPSRLERLPFLLGDFFDAYIWYHTTAKKLGIDMHKHTFEKLLEIYINLPPDVLNDLQRMPLPNGLTSILHMIIDNIKKHDKFNLTSFKSSINLLKCKKELWPQITK